jgi:hypothetical protein
MPWLRLFADSTYRNPSIWSCREWLTVMGLGVATIIIVAILLWPIARLLIEP